MKYSPEILKSYGITYHIYQDDMTYEHSIVIESDLMRYKTTMIDIQDYNAIDILIDKFLVKIRKEKLIRLNDKS